jgi:hexosaminidase
MKRGWRTEIGNIPTRSKERSGKRAGVNSGWNTRNGRDWVRFWGAVILACGICVAPGLCAGQEQSQDGAGQANSAAAQLQLVPQPREAKLSGGEGFAVTRHTRILVNRSFGEGFQGAEMLAEEIERWTGWKLKISEEREMPGGSDFIYIGDATKDSKLREALGTSGLAMQNGFDSQGYTILADHRRILVGGASAQGAFYGVQTLRQLLRPANAGNPDTANTTADSPVSGVRWTPPESENRTSPSSAAKTAAAGFGMTTQKQQLLEVADFSTPSTAKGPFAAHADSSSPLAGSRSGLLGMTGESGGGQNDAAVNGATGKSRGAKGDAEVNEKNGTEIWLECPAVAIRDWPAMKWRGVSIDISRGPIPKLEFMEKQIRTLASYKLNMYALYMEDVFTVKGNQIFAPPDALTPEEIKQLVAYAQKYYVTIVPELETFGHLHNILRYDLYSDLAEIPHGSVLTPTEPGTYDLLGKLIAEMEPLFPGPFFHIGADETFELGQGKTKQLIAQQGLGPVYLAHIAKLDAMLKPYGKQTMFWADIAEKFPQLLPTLPKDLIAVIWTYDNAPSYDNRLKPFQDAGLKMFVSPGITDWRRVYPDFNYSFLNIRNLTRDGQKYGALGMLNTDWKDMGEALEGMAWPGFVYGAACGWQAGESDIGQFRDSYDWAFYRNTDHTFEGILDKLAATNTLLDGVNLEGTHVRYFWSSPFSQDGAQDAETAAPVVHEMRVDAEQAWEALLDNRAKARLHADSLDDLVFAAQRLDFMGMKLEYTEEMSAAYWDAYMDMSNTRKVYGDLETISSINGDLQDLREKLTQLRSEYAERWRAENNEAWLGNVLSRYDAFTNIVQNKMDTIVALEGDFSGVKVLPPPENMGFYYRPGKQ